MNLIKYRDAGMHTYTYFWTLDERVASPYFNTENDAFDWLQSITDGGDQVSTWRDSRDGNTVGDDRKSSKPSKCK
jgi:hypothetical protein